MAKSTKTPVKSKECSNDCCARSCAKIPCSDNGVVYGLGFIGAAIYYIQTATGFWNGVLGILKALVWPAMLVYKLIGL